MKRENIIGRAKGFACAVLACMCLCTGAYAQTQWDAYRVESEYGTQVLPLAGGDVLAMHRARLNDGIIPTSVVRYHAGEAVVRAALKDDRVGGQLPECYTTPFALSDGRCGVFISEGDACSVAFLGDSGLLPPVKVAEDALEGFVGDLGSVVLSPFESQSLLTLRDFSGNVFLQRPIQMQRPMLRAVEADGAHAQLLMITGVQEGQAQVLRVTDTGEVTMECRIDLPDVNAAGAHFGSAFPDGAGGAYVAGSLVENYKMAVLARVDAQGKLCGARLMRTKNAITAIQYAKADPAAGTVTLYGTVVAASRGLYDAFAMTLDAQGNICALDVRDFGAVYEDYGAMCVHSPDGAVYLYYAAMYGSKTQGSALLVPFEALPAADDPGITLR